MHARLSSCTSRPAAVLAAVVGALLLVGLLSGAPVARADDPPATQATGSTYGRYFAIPPTRVLATRGTTPLGPGETRTVDLSAAFTARASAVALNLTSSDATVPSQQTVFPAGTSVPYAASINELAGEVRSNAVTVAVGQGAFQNKINIYNWYGRANVSVDVLGYYSSGDSAPGAGAAYQPLASPVRLFDTRSTIGPLTRYYPKNIGIVTIDYGSPALNRAITSIVINITAMVPGGSGYLAMWDGSGALPKTSTLNFRAGASISNMTNVPVRCSNAACTSNTFSIYNVSSSVNVIGDVLGAFVTAGTPGSLVYRPVAPTRITDTRYNRPFPALGTQGTGTVPAGAWNAAAFAAIMNVAAVRPPSGTYLTAWQNGTPQPAVANVYPAPAGVLTSTAIQVRLVPNTKGMQVYSRTGPTTVVIDLAGTYVLDPALSAPSAAAAGTRAPADTGTAAVSGTIAGS